MADTGFMQAELIRAELDQAEQALAQQAAAAESEDRIRAESMAGLQEKLNSVCKEARREAELHRELQQIHRALLLQEKQGSKAAATRSLQLAFGRMIKGQAGMCVSTWRVLTEEAKVARAGEVLTSANEALEAKSQEVARLVDQGHQLKLEIASSQERLTDLGESTDELGSIRETLATQLAEAVGEVASAKSLAEERAQKIQEHIAEAAKQAALHSQGLEHQTESSKLEAENRVLAAEKQVLEVEDRFHSHLQERDEELKMLTDMLQAVQEEKETTLAELLTEQKALREAQLREHDTVTQEKDAQLHAFSFEMEELRKFQHESETKNAAVNRGLVLEGDKLKVALKELQLEIQEHIFNAMEVRAFPFAVCVCVCVCVSRVCCVCCVRGSHLRLVLQKSEAKVSQIQSTSTEHESKLREKLEQLKGDLLDAQEALIEGGNSAKESVYAEKQKQREATLKLQQEHNGQVPRAPGLVMPPRATV